MNTLPSLNELVSLKGKTALITGSAIGIGKTIASRFAEAGADLELVDVNKRGLRTVKRELSKFESEVNIHGVDVSQKDAIDTLWQELSGEEPDILVNNAGIYPFKNFLEVDEAFFKKVMDVNLSSAFWMCHNMIRSRLKKGGVIINVSSIEAILPFASDLVPYNISKTGVIALTRALAKEYGRNGFKINGAIFDGHAAASRNRRNCLLEVFLPMCIRCVFPIRFYRNDTNGRWSGAAAITRHAAICTKL